MGLMDIVKGAIAGTAEVMMVTKGADILINRHTEFNMLLLNKNLKKYTDNIIKQYVLNSGEERLTEENAALLKLAILYSIAEQEDNKQMQALLGDSITKLKNALGDKISPSIYLQVLGQTGL